MSIKTCKQHTKEPVFIYAACAGCEIQRYRDKEKALNAENESLRADADRYQRLKLDASMGGSLIERLDCNVPVKLWDFAIDRELAK